MSGIFNTHRRENKYVQNVYWNRKGETSSKGVDSDIKL